jgi:hypothetical protein
MQICGGYMSSFFPPPLEFSFHISKRRYKMKKILAILASGAVVAAFAGVAASADLETTGTDMMKKADEQSGKVTETKEKAKGKASEAVKKKDKVKESAKQKKKKATEIKESKSKSTEKMTQASEEGQKSVQEMKDMKKELK